MSNLSEEEIIKKIKRYINGKDTMKETLVRAIQGLLDLYNKEKEKNKKLKEKCKELIKEKQELTTILEDDVIHKNKIKEKLEEINKEYFKKLSKQKKLMEQNILGCQRYAMENILRELLER